MAVADEVSRQTIRQSGDAPGANRHRDRPVPRQLRFLCLWGGPHPVPRRPDAARRKSSPELEAFAREGDLYALFLMTMHDFALDHLLEVIQASTQVHSAADPNRGEHWGLRAWQAKELRQAGVHGAYHVCRLREGTDTQPCAGERKKTFRTIRDAGLDFYYCCEPIGPEHTPEELVEQMFLGIEYGCFQHAAMRRVFVPGMPLSSRGQITELRLAQVVAVVSLATLGCSETQNIAVHEPNLLGLTAGANLVYAETGANPRDTEADTSRNRGIDMADCRKMIYEAGFTALRCGDDSTVPLDLNRIEAA